MPQAEHVILCNCVHRTLYPPGVRERVLDGLAASGIRLTLVEDLCELAADKTPALKALTADSHPVIIACYPRAVHWLLHTAGVAPPAVSLPVLNMRTLSTEAILEKVGAGLTPPRQTAAAPSRATPPPHGPWIPWFPVIDYDRCVQCRQCVSFCPFGVYSVRGETVVVTAPRNCKDNCPACARMCPRQAIMFPKVPDSPINGDEVTDQAIQEARQRVEEQKKELAEEDIHSVLAKRKLRARLRQP